MTLLQGDGTGGGVLAARDHPHSYAVHPEDEDGEAQVVCLTEGKWSAARGVSVMERESVQGTRQSEIDRAYDQWAVSTDCGVSCE